MPVVQQSSYAGKTSKVVSNIIFYQNNLFVHTRHTLKSNLLFFSKYRIIPADLPFFTNFFSFPQRMQRLQNRDDGYKAWVWYQNDTLNNILHPGKRIWRNKVKTKITLFWNLEKYTFQSTGGIPIFFTILVAKNQGYSPWEYKKTSGSKKYDFWGKVVQKLSY